MKKILFGRERSSHGDFIGYYGMGIRIVALGLLIMTAQAEPSTPGTQPSLWVPTFSDEFNSASLDATKWEAPNETRQGGQSTWNSDQVSVGNGSLRLGITEVVDPVTGLAVNYKCGAVRGRQGYTSNYFFKQKYGYFEARYKLPVSIDKDFWASFWLMAGPVASTTETKVGMEIDIMESFTLARPNHTANFHWGGYGNNHNKVSIPLDSPTQNWAKNTMLSPAGQFHTYGFYWDPDVYVFYLDGTEIGRTNMVGIGDNVTKPTPANPTLYPTYLANGTTQAEGYIIFSCEAAAWAGKAGWEVAAPDADEFLIDYVRVYDKKPSFISDPFTQTNATESTSYLANLAGSATDDSGGTLTYSKVSGPSWLGVAANGTISGTPNNEHVGLNIFKVCVSDGISSVESTLHITVSSFFDHWSSNNSLTFSGDGNLDHIPDGLAWLLGAATPADNAKDRLPSFERSLEGGLTMGFRCLKASKRGAASLSLQLSSDLGISDPWSNHQVFIPETSGTDPATGVNFTISPNGDYNDVQATIPPGAVGEGGKLFSRLMATGSN